MIRSAPTMVVLGLTGGIGSGKSTVAEMLAATGATVIDADRLARDVVAPGTAGYEDVVARFGSPVVADDGSLDRRALADIVFADLTALADLNAIVHPAVRAAIAEQLAELRASGPDDGVVVLEIPLLIESGRSYGAAAVIVVDCEEEVAIRRLVENRGMHEADARRRMAAQLPRADRVAAADIVIDNSGSRADLHRQVDLIWAGLIGQPRSRHVKGDRRSARPLSANPEEVDIVGGVEVLVDNDDAT